MGAQVNHKSLSSQTKLDTTMCPEGKQGTNKSGRRGMVLVRAIREQLAGLL